MVTSAFSFLQATFAEWVGFLLAVLSHQNTFRCCPGRHKNTRYIATIKDRSTLFNQSSDPSRNRIKVETHDATNRCDTSPRQVATTNRLVWHVKVIVAPAEFCRRDLSHEFKLVWIRATNRSDISQRQNKRKISSQATNEGASISFLPC